MFGFAKNRRTAVDRHFEIVESLRSEKDESRLISLCEEDIALVDDFKRDWTRKQEQDADAINLKGSARKKYVALPPTYPSYNKLAIIYEKHKEYDKAIQICQDAIKAGFTGDSFQGGIRERLRKLKEKKQNAKKKEGTLKKA